MRLEPCVCSGVRPQTQEMLNVRRNSPSTGAAVYLLSISFAQYRVPAAVWGGPDWGAAWSTYPGKRRQHGRASKRGRRAGIRAAACCDGQPSRSRPKRKLHLGGQANHGSVSTSNATAGNPAARNWSGSLERRLLSYFDSSLVAAFAMVRPQVSPNASVNEPKHNNRRHADSTARVGRDRFPP